MDADERELLAKTLAQVASDRTGESLDAALDDLGWRDALAVEPRVAVSALFEAQGAANATSSALDHVLLAALGLDTTAAVPGAGGTGAATATSTTDTSATVGGSVPALGPELAGMAGRMAVVLPALGRPDAPGELGGDDRLAVRGLGTAALARAPFAVIVAGAVASGGAGAVAGAGAGPGDAAGGGPPSPGQPIVAVVDSADLTLRPVRGLDPELALVEVTGNGLRSVTRSVPPPAVWSAAVAAGQRAIAHELVGASRTMLRLARDHALDRIQFGRPIASFQAVRHRLADTLVAIEAADAALQAAWGDGTPLTAALAKALAGRGARVAAKHCQQVLAGIGFTTEHPLHHHVKRALVLDRLLGDARALTHRLGADLLATRRLPSLLPL